MSVEQLALVLVAGLIVYKSVEALAWAIGMVVERRRVPAPYAGKMARRGGKRRFHARINWFF